MMLSFVKHVTFLRLFRRAYSKAYRTMRSQSAAADQLQTLRDIGARRCSIPP